MRTQIQTIHVVRWLGSDNQPMSYHEVRCGDSARDYMMRDYKPARCVGKFRTRDAAEAYVLSNEIGFASR